MGTQGDSNERDRTDDVFWLVEKIKAQLSEFEELRESIRSSVGLMVKLIPGLEEQKRILQTDLEEESKKTAQIEELIPRLERQREELQQEMRQKQEEISRVDDQLKFFLQMRMRKA